MTDSETDSTTQALLDGLIRWRWAQRRFYRKQLYFLESPRFSENPRARFANRAGLLSGYREALLVGTYTLNVLFAIRHAFKGERVLAR